ncbi:hypothetical protein J4218_03520 [Candidatus Pacearchaeota archaeon]|nr:hypothetical protein [Candidatus Pacearchaeota archaeon]
MKILLIMVILLLVGGFLIISNENIRLNSWENILHFSNLYYNWLINSYDYSKGITGDVVNFFRPGK